MKKTTIFLSILIFILLLLIGILVILLIKSASDTAQLQATINSEMQEFSDAASSDTALEVEDVPAITTKHFVDVGLGINIAYPSDWEWVLDTQVSEDFAEMSAYKSMETYSLDFTKGTNTIAFSAIFGAVGDIGMQYPESEYDVVVLTSDVIRVKQIGESAWRYLSQIDCEDSMDWDGETEVCGAGGFFPGFAEGGASTVSFTGSDSLLEEVDAIVLTAVN